jgi:homoserine kinase
MNRKVTVQIPATSANLGPGFDVLGIALRLYNEVSFSADAKGFTPFRHTPNIVIEIEGEGSGTLPRDHSNLVVRAAFKVFERARKWPAELHVKLVNRIPLSRGLGSSSAASLGGICAANALIGKALSDHALLELAVGLEGHPDNVVPAMVGGFCISGVIDHQVRYLKFAVPSSLRAVVCIPERPLETREARRVLPSRIPFSAAVFTSSRVAFLVGALLQKRYAWLSFAMEDVLHQTPRANLIPGLKEAICEAKKAGAYGSALSGAGSSVIAFSEPGPVAHRVGLAMQKAFALHGMPSRFQELVFENKGVRLSPSARFAGMANRFADGHRIHSEKGERR